MLDTFAKNKALEEIAGPKVGLQTGDNARFVREWWEVSQSKLKLTSDNAKDRKTSACDKWFPYNKGGEYRKWYGNQDYVINWENAGQELYDFKPKSVIRNPQFYFQFLSIVVQCVFWDSFIPVLSGRFHFQPCW